MNPSLHMRLKKSELAEKIGVSERALTSWQARGMPVLEHGRRGQKNAYDLAAVVRWMRHTGAGMVGGGGRREIDLAALEREIRGLSASADVCIEGHQLALARAIALARVAHFRALREWDFNSPIVDQAAIGDLLIGQIVRQLALGPFAPASRILDAVMGEAAYPSTFEEILARMEAEVPPETMGPR